MHQGLCVGWRHDDHMCSKFQEEASDDPWEMSRELRGNAGEVLADPRRFRAKSNGDPDLCDTSVVLRLRAHASQGDNSDETRQKSACDSLQDDEMEVSSADIATAGKMVPDPSEPSCEIVGNQKL